MRRIIKTFSCLFTGIILCFCFFNSSFTTVEDSLKHSENNIHYSDKTKTNYYYDKYDLFNIDNKYIHIVETIPLSMNKTYYSTNTNINKVDVDMVIDKEENIISLTLDVILEETTYSDFYTINVVNIDNEIYAVSRYSWIKVEDIIIQNEKINYGVNSAWSGLVGNQMCTFDDVGYGYGAMGAIGAAIGGVLVAGITSLANNTTTTYTPSYTPSPTTPTNSQTNSHRKPALEQLKFEREASDFLHGEANNYGWTYNNLTNGFKDACNKVVNGEIVKIDDIFEQEIRPMIVLGIYKLTEYHKPYTIMSQENEGAIVYSMDNDTWKDLSDNHGGIDGMWLLNKFFLEHWISKNCYFLLVTNPNYFYVPPVEVNTNVSFGTSYRKELKHIYSRGYRWICSLPETELVNSFIFADR